MYNKKEREFYNQHRDIVCEELKFTKNDYNYFRRVGEDIQKLCENNCNGVLNEIDYSRQLTHCEAILIGRMARMDRLDINYYIQTDPRGASLYLSLKSLDQTNYDRGNCIY